MKKVLFVLFVANCALSSMAQVKTAVTEFNLSGPYAVATPFALDTVDVKGAKFDPASLMVAFFHLLRIARALVCSHSM